LATKFAAIALFAAVLARTGAAEDTNAFFELQIRITNLAGGTTVLDLTRENGLWHPVMVGWRAHGANAQWGYVVSNEIADATMKFTIAVFWNGDAWIGRGHYGSFDISLSKATNGLWFGEAIRREPVRSLIRTDNAVARILSRPIRYPDWRPLEPGEHPRILVRKQDIPRLRERMKTPFGQEAVRLMQAATNDLLSQAMMYCLTEDKSCIERLVPLFENAILLMEPGHVGVNFRQHQRNVGMAYDLCRNGLPPRLQVSVEEYLWKFVEAGLDNLHWLSAGMNTHPCSNYYGPIIGSFAIASLLFVGQTGPEPVRPIPPMGMKAGGSDALSKLTQKYASADKTAAEREMYEFDMIVWKSQSEWWKADGGQDQARKLVLRRMWYQMYRNYRLGIGDGGFQSETDGYSSYAFNNPVLYSALHQRVFGRDATAFSDATHWFPRQMMCAYYPVALGADGTGREVGQTVQGWNGINLGLLAEAYNGIPEQHRPGLLWLWNFRTGVTNEASKIKAAMGQAPYPVFAFVNYPLDATPVHPRESMPLTWQATTRGLYVYRSGWEGKDEFIGQVWAKSTPIGGHNQPNGGTFRVFGFGHKWVAHSGGKGLYERERHSVVVLPDDEISESGNALVPHFDTKPDGSGDVTLDMAFLYGKGALYEGAEKEQEAAAAAPQARAHPLSRKELMDRKAKKEQGPRRRRLVDSNFEFYPHYLDPDSIKGWRAVAFDYSGKSGSPCLLVLADKVEGGKTKEWTWQVPIAEEPKPPKVTVEGNSFTFDYGDANMRGTFVAPLDVSVRYDTSTGVIVKAGSALAGTTMQKIEYARNMVAAKGRTGTEGDFFVVATFQRGAPPPVKVEGEGMAAIVTVGGQKVRLVGNRIVVGP
jgi:hypothetical protein